ncbi:MAG: bifunctional folylpolyglutamate synthase/dihydrofolate synthase [Lachnospiraceae bacterium]|nr:bifunctional folylpolyglutamate synthase/dihydrofolate synthase [Lachnospiraceae bacterium]
MCTYKEAEAYILDIPRFAGKHTLKDTQELLAKITGSGVKSRIIHVAGTNGKGSVCAYLQSLLMEAGFSVGMFTSPHLQTMRERIRINGQMLSEEAFTEAFLCVKAISREGAHPSFFEFLFLMAMYIYGKAAPDFIILETGLGGRLDATNAVEKKEIAVITHMGLDHTEYLGDTLEKITEEKAGILKKDAPVVYFRTNAEVSTILSDYAAKLQISTFEVSKKDYTFSKIHHKGIDFSYRSLYYDSVRLHLNTIAAYQMENAALALRTLEVLLGKEVMEPGVMQQGMIKAFWAGRMEEILPGVYVDGAHNDDGMRAFLETVEKDDCRGNRYLFFGVAQDKHYEHMIEQIAKSNLFEKIFPVKMENPRALSQMRLKEVFLKYTDRCAGGYSSVREALQALYDMRGEQDRVYITGSLYLVGEIKELL